MDRAAQLDFPLNVDHFALSQTDPCRDPAGLAEGKIPQLENGQPVDLADMSPFGLDRDRFAEHLFPESLLNAIDAVYLCLDRFVNILKRDRISLGYTRPIVALP